MATNLSTLIQQEQDAINTARQAISAARSAQEKLTALNAVQSDLLAVKTLVDSKQAIATAQLAATKTAAGQLEGQYVSVASKVAAQLAALNVTETTLTGVVNATLKAPLDTTKKYSDYAQTKSQADAAVDEASDDLKAARRQVTLTRGVVDDRAAALTRYVDAVSKRLERARLLYSLAGERAAAGETAAAWWLLTQARALVTGIQAADATALVTALTTASNDYATAVADALTAEDDLATAIADQAKAGDDLKLAGEQVLTALKAAAVATP